MTPLKLRSVNTHVARATQALGAGARLPFRISDWAGALSLHPLANVPSTRGLWLNSAIGPVWLSDADAVLSLLSEHPVVVQGPAQPWYWQFVSQHLAPSIARSLSPLEPLTTHVPEGPLVHCRVEVQAGEQQVHAYLSMPPQSLLQWLQVPGWQRLQRPLDEGFEVTFSVPLGYTELSAQQLASLRPGDVLLPQQCLFDTQGRGSLEIAGQQWAGEAAAQGSQLLFILSHEESLAS